MEPISSSSEDSNDPVDDEPSSNIVIIRTNKEPSSSSSSSSSSEDDHDADVSSEEENEEDEEESEEFQVPAQFVVVMTLNNGDDDDDDHVSTSSEEEDEHEVQVIKQQHQRRQVLEESEANQEAEASSNAESIIMRKEKKLQEQAKEEMIQQIQFQNRKRVFIDHSEGEPFSTKAQEVKQALEEAIPDVTVIVNVRKLNKLGSFEISAGDTTFCKLLVTTTPLSLSLLRASRSFSCSKPFVMASSPAQETRVLIAPDPGTSGNGLGHTILLRHPKSGNATQYLFVNGVLQELQWFKNLYGSWFLGDYVSEDGRLYLSTPIDPVFIMLPTFEEARMKKGDDPGKFRQLDEILFVDGYPGYQQLTSIVENCMQIVCEVKEMGSLKFFRLDDSKVLRWLCYKVCQLKQTLPKLDKNYAAQEEKDTLVDAVSILGEYLKEEPWLRLLCNHLKLNVLEVTGKAQVSADGSNSAFCNELQEKSDDKKAAVAKKGRQAKKVKLETESHNIKDMFSRATRKKR
ncbi:hypothetical protein RIF29_12228 [Crotalaria pallida]|uniref:Ribonuclease H2 subunit B n=1 Tax=Crotalaria pallida TaxID=3830 RepID=A0AAN9P1K8_CROPI